MDYQAGLVPDETEAVPLQPQVQDPTCGHAACCPDCGDYCIYNAGHGGAHRCGNNHEWW